MAYLIIVLLSTALCGLVGASPTNSRVVGGYEAASGQFPHQVSLRFDDSHICGGSIISYRHILTAAHCVVSGGNDTYSAQHFSIRAGSFNRAAGGIVIPVKRIVVHPEYKYYNDLAILELEKYLPYSSKIQPIELFDGEVPENSKVTISGWGVTVNNGGYLPFNLQYHILTALSKRSCALKIAHYSDALLCLSHGKNAGACNGDSGGPAIYDGKLVGVAGFVFIKCGTSRPDGYGKVSYNRDWISENMK